MIYQAQYATARNLSQEECNNTGEQAMKYRHYKGGIHELACEAKLEATPLG